MSPRSLERCSPIVTTSPVKLLINNKWVDSLSERTFPTVNPATGDELARIAEGDAADVDAAVRAARSAFEIGPWSRMPGSERGKLLYRLADAIESAGDNLCRLEALDSG